MLQREWEAIQHIASFLHFSGYKSILDELTNFGII